MRAIFQKYASDPRPPHTRQKYEQTSGQSMTPNASKQGKFGSLGAIFLFIFLPCMWGLGLQKESPILSGKTELSTTTALDQILADPGEAMVDMILLCVSRIRVSTVDLGTQSSILLSGGSGRWF